MFLLVRALVLDLALVLVVAVVVTIVAVVVGVLVTLVVGVVIAVAAGTSHVAGLLVLQIRMYGLAKTGFQSLKISSGA